MSITFDKNFQRSVSYVNRMRRKKKRWKLFFSKSVVHAERKKDANINRQAAALKKEP